MRCSTLCSSSTLRLCSCCCNFSSAASAQLEALGTPEKVFLIPGNHDCYVATPASASWDYWSAYLAGAPSGELDAGLGELLAPARMTNQAPRHEDYPTLRVHGRLATIGLCSAIPTPVFRAGGRLGPDQLDRLERLLNALRDRNLCRVVMIHHPVSEEGEPARRALWDGDSFRDVLSRAGAELVIHGHKHRRRLAMLPGPTGEIPVIGVPSSSEIGSRPEKRAQYHLYTLRFEDSDDDRVPAFRIEAEIRGFDATTGEFEHVDEPLL